MPVEAVEPVDAGGSRQMKAGDPSEPVEEVQSTQAEKDADADKSSPFPASFPSVHSEYEVDWGGEGADETIEARSQSDEHVPREYQVHPALETIVTRIRSKRDESVEERHLQMLRSLETVEKAYTADLRKLHKAFTCESLGNI